MEEESNTSQIQNAFATFGISDQIFPQSLKFIMHNINHIVNVQLNAENYPMWRSQILKLLSANDYQGFLDGTTLCPPSLISNPSGQTTPNPAHKAWKLLDQNLSSALCSTITTTILPYVINLESTHAIWTTIEKRLQATNRSRVIQLKSELHNVSMKTQTMAQYLTQIKTIVDSITAAGANIDTEDIVLYTLNGLPPQYQAFKTAIRTKLHPISLDDFYSLLCSEEINTARETTILPTTEPIKAFYAPRGRGRSSPYRGRGRCASYSGRRGGTSPQTPRSTVQCQICSRIRHNAMQCWHRLNPNYIPTATTSAPTALTAASVPPH